MKLWAGLWKILLLIVIIFLLFISFQLYNLLEQQKKAIEALNNDSKMQVQVNENKYKFQQEKIEHLIKDLESNKADIYAQKNALADQKDELLQEIEKRQQVENAVKSLQTSVIDLKAEADAIKQDMKNWQKDYVSVLAQLEKKTDDWSEGIKNLKSSIDALDIPDIKIHINSLQTAVDKILNPPINSKEATPPVEKKIEHLYYTSPLS